MSEDTLDIDTGDGLVQVNYKIPPEAKQALADYAALHKIPLRSAISHILLSVGKTPDCIPKPSQYEVKFELGNSGSVVTVAMCEKCSEGYSPVNHGNSVEDFMQWIELHKHGKKG